jgi:pimeloyl-ACP methyl ester carboxylesterase
VSDCGGSAMKLEPLMNSGAPESGATSLLKDREMQNLTIHSYIFCKAGTLMLITALAVALLLLWPQESHAEPARQTPSCNWADETYEDFYVPPPLDGFAPEQSGTLLRVKHVRTYTPQQVAFQAGRLISQYGAELYQVLYISQSPPGTLRAVSGLIAVPTGNQPAAGFPLVVFGAGTLGMADQCAPSKRGALTEVVLMRAISEGFMVSATDYVGLGTPGLHPYGVGEATGPSLLDAGRAALNFCDSARGITQPASNRIFIMGHSQGGHSALFAHQQWQAYAPELNLLGTIVFAPGAEPKFLVQQMAKQALSARIAPLAMAMVSFSQYYGSPANLQPWLKEPYATTLPEMVENQCVAELVLELGVQPANVFQPLLLKNALADQWSILEPWDELMEMNTPGNYASNVPVLIIHGQLDQTVPFGASQRLLHRLCEAGTPTYLSRHNSSHFNVMVSGSQETVSWMLRRLNGELVASQCAEAPSLWEIEPVVLKGAEIPELQNAPIQKIFAYAYHANDGWRQIPLQIDKMTAAGHYVEDSRTTLGANDEIVVMARDLGEVPPGNVLLDSILPIHSKWYVVDVANPLDTSQQGRFYLVHSSSLAPITQNRYVQFDQAERQVVGQSYRLGLNSTQRWVNFLSLNGGPNILDRIKLRFDCADPNVCPVTEEMSFLNPGAIISGPIRLVTQSGELIAYDSKVVFKHSVRPPAGRSGSVRLSFDFNLSAMGATLHNASQPDYVTVDGVPDSVPEKPVSSWWQLATESGTLIQLMDTSLLTASATNYYEDNSAIDASDTGDKRRFGDFGIHVEGISDELPLTYELIFLANVHQSLGAAYAQQKLHPLSIEVSLGDAPKPVDEFRLHLPKVLK